MNPTWEDPIEEDDDAGYDKTIIHGRDAVIFLIDATESMFESGEDEETPFNLCLKCARTSLTNKIVGNNKDLQAVVLFGTEKSKNENSSSDFKHIYVFQDLGEPGAERIMEIEELMGLDHNTFSENYGHSPDFSLADALWTCSLLFSNCSYKLAHKRILIFTATDMPHSDDQLMNQARTKARDIADNNIDIELMHIQKTNSIFDISRFYKDIIYAADDEGGKMPDASEKFDELLTRVRSKDHKKRPIASIKFIIANDLQIGITMYKLVVSTPKPTAAKLCKENNAELTSTTKTFLGDTGQVLWSTDLKKYQEYGGKKIYLDEDELKEIKNFGSPGLLLMGFKPAKFVKLNHHIRPSLFAYPDENSVEGSTRLFFALLCQCQKRGYVPVCRLILRQNDQPKFVALMPQEECVDAHGTQTIPPGFHVIYLPFMEDIRNIVPEPKHNPSENLVEKAKEIIKKLQFAYHPESFENPVLQKHWRNIEALALNKDAPEEITDYTLPTKDVIEKRAGKLIDEFKALLCPGAGEYPGDKRQMGGSYGGQAKRAKVEQLSVPLSLLEEAKCGQLTRFKVNVLKEFCKNNGIRCGSKKADIIQAIQEFYEVQ